MAYIDSIKLGVSSVKEDHSVGKENYGSPLIADSQKNGRDLFLVVNENGVLVEQEAITIFFSNETKEEESYIIWSTIEVGNADQLGYVRRIIVLDSFIIRKGKTLQRDDNKVYLISCKIDHS